MLRILILAVLASLASGQQPNGIATVAGTGVPGYGATSPATTALIETSYALAVDDFGNLYLADSWNHRIRKVSPGGAITVVAGTGERGFSGDGGSAIAARLNYPRGVALDGKGNIYISDSGNARIRQIRPDGIIATIAGTGTHGFGGDGGIATVAQLAQPRGLAVDRSGNVFIADSGNFRVRRIAAGGRIDTIAGAGTFGNDGDGQAATRTRIGMPFSVSVDETGNVYFADPFNHVVRRVGANGTITTVAGTGRQGFSGDGGAATNALLRYPKGVAADSLGNLYVADTGNHRIRRIGTNALITSVAGTTRGQAGDGGPAAVARLDTPYGLATDLRGNVFVADQLNYRIRKVRSEALTDAPEISSGGVVSAADLVTAPSPGGLFAVFGKNFSYRTASAAVLPLDNVIHGASISINGNAVPLVFASPTQINAQVPWDLAPGTAILRVNFGGVESAAYTLQVPALAPMAFVSAERRGAIINENGTVNSPSQPAPRGSTITIYATGLGPVSARPANGGPAGSSPLSSTLQQTSIRFGNAAGTVFFSGLTPGLVGLWQVNVRIPPNAPAGSDVLTEIQTGAAISRTFLVSIRSEP